MIVQLVVAAGNRTGHIIPVTTEKFIIGRADDCHLKPRSELISRYHCAILVGDDVVVRDLGSKNGVRLNGEKVSGEQKLKKGDKLVVGPLEFFVHIADSADESAEGGNANASWQPQNDGDDTSGSAVTVLLDHLKTLNNESGIAPEKPVKELLKKFS